MAGAGGARRRSLPTRPAVRAAGSASGPGVTPGHTEVAASLALETSRAGPGLGLPLPWHHWKCPAWPESSRAYRGRKLSLCGWNQHDSAQGAWRPGPPPGSTPCCHLSGGPRRHLPWGPCGAHGARAPCHSSLQEHHCLAGCQEQPSPVDRAPGNPTKRKQTCQISRPHPWAWQISPGVHSPDPRACWGHTKTACPWRTTHCSSPQPVGVNCLPGTEVVVGVSTLRKCGT